MDIEKNPIFATPRPEPNPLWIDLDGIEKRCASATPGPWKAQPSGGADAIVRCIDGRTFSFGDAIYHRENRDNAELAAHARADLPALCAWVRRAQALLRKYYELDLNSPWDGDIYALLAELGRAPE